MDVLELDNEQIKILLKKAYEWLAKIHKPKHHHRIDYYKTIRIIKKIKKVKKANTTFIPNKTEIVLMLQWFKRCPPRYDKEIFALTSVGLIYLLHKNKLVDKQKSLS